MENRGQNPDEKTGCKKRMEEFVWESFMEIMETEERQAGTAMWIRKETSCLYCCFVSAF